MIRLRRTSIFSSALVLPLLVLAGSPLAAQSTSRWSTTPTSTDWFDPLNWNNGVPNLAGDIAAVAGSAVRDVEVDVTAEATLGQLDLLGVGELTIGGAGPLVFDNPGDDPASIQTFPPRSTGVDAEVATPISIAGGEALVVNVVQGNSVTLSGGIVSTTGDVTKTGAGPLTLAGDSSVWEGALIIDSGEVVVTNPASLGTTQGATYVGSLAQLSLPNRIVFNEHFILDGGELATRSSIGGSATFNDSIELVSDSRLLFRETAALNGRITGDGGVTYTVATLSRALVDGDNDYQGTTIVRNGTVTIQQENGLGSPAMGTIVESGGQLTLEKAVSEPLRLVGGRIVLASDATSTGELTIESGELGLPRDATFQTPIVLAASGGSALLTGGDSVLTDGITGVGTLTIAGNITVDGAPLAHEGDLLVVEDGDLTLNTPNTYSGETRINGGRMAVNHPDALGIATLPVELETGELTLNVSLDRDIRITGVLKVDTPGHVFGGTMWMGDPDRTSFQTADIRGQGTFIGDIVLNGSPTTELVLRAGLTGGTFNGVIRGGADRLSISNNTVLNGDNTYRGRTEIRGPVQANTARALGSPDEGTLVTDGVLDINVVLDEPLVVQQEGRVNVNVQQTRLPRLFSSGQFNPPRTQVVAVNHPGAYLEDVDVYEGILEVNADTTINDAVIRAGGKLIVTPGASLHVVDDNIELQSGRIEGALTGVQLIRKTSGIEAELGGLPSYMGDIAVEHGRLRVLTGESFGTPDGITRVSGRDAVLQLDFSVSPDIYEDIFLDNALGDNFAGGLFVSRLGARLRGRIDLGDQGSRIHDGTLEFHGPITGGSLITKGEEFRGRIYSEDLSYTGATDIQEGRIELLGSARLLTTSRVILHEGSASFEGTLSLNNRDTKLDDRLADSIPIDFHGGELVSDGELDETVGIMHFIEGDSAIDMHPSSSDAELEKQLTIQSITRRAGATALMTVSEANQILVSESPTMAGGILPWMYVVDRLGSAVADTGFGVISERGIVPLTDYHTDINSADATSNVRISGETSITRDTSLNSVSTGNSNATLDLNGNALTIESGGILFNRSASITNGQLTAGAEGGYELVFPAPARIEADIVDNDGHSVSVTGRGVLSGDNSYTGATYAVEDELIFQGESSLPSNTDLFISGSEVELDYPSTTSKQLNTIRISEGGSLGSNFSGQNTIEFQELILECGIIEGVALVGSGNIIKTTDGEAYIARTAESTFSGQVTVESGLLGARPYPNAQFIVTGGSLGLSGGGAQVELAGGDLLVGESAFSAFDYSPDSTIHVTAASRIVFQGPRPSKTMSRPLTGTGDLYFTGRNLIEPRRDQAITVTSSNPDYSGNVVISSITVNARTATALGTGQLTVHSDGVLSFFGSGSGNSSDRLTIENNIHLAGGRLVGNANAETQFLAGDLQVSGMSEIGNFQVQGDTYLANDSRLTTITEDLTQFVGDIWVGGYTEFEYGTTLIEINASGVDFGTTQLLGTIRANAPISVLNLIDRGLDEAVIDVTLHAEAGQSLTLLKDGQPMELTLSGDDNALTGNGTMGNDVDLSDGAAVSPGDSAGLLTIDGSADLGIGSRFIVELGGLLRGTQHDGLDVTGDVTLAGALELSLIDGFIPSPDDVFAILQAESIAGKFSNAAQSIRIGDFLFTVDYQASQVVLTNAAVVPEPQSMALLLLGLTALVGAGVRSRHSG